MAAVGVMGWDVGVYRRRAAASRGAFIATNVTTRDSFSSYF